MKPGADVATGGIEDKQKQRKDEETISGQEMLWGTAAVMMLCIFCPFLNVNAAEEHGGLRVHDESTLMAAFLLLVTEAPRKTNKQQRSHLSKPVWVKDFAHQL